MFEDSLNNNEVPEDAIGFIEDTKEIWNHGTYFDGSKTMENILYADLVLLRNNGQLVPGQMYRIIDYVTTTVLSETKSANHPFDIIVTALNENTLDEKASAIAHEEDTYFDGNDLSAWELWYDLDNDTDKYEWADATNGKGVIYRMIDEKRNDCPYDFKNILFYNDKYTDGSTTDKYYFTFSYVVSGVLYDGTVEKQVYTCYGNEMGVYIRYNKQSLNKNVFWNAGFNHNCYSNILGNGCYSNIFGSSCYCNTFGYGCHSNIFGYHCSTNTFGYGCRYNEFDDFGSDNKFGNFCEANIFGSYCQHNTLGDYCQRNTFGSYCQHNTLGNNCESNKFATYVLSCTVDNYVCRYNLKHYETSITRNDEYYDDRSGQLVPIKHPDLSTQPSILPYKFMGQYVYEVLIFVGAFDKDNTEINRLIQHNELKHRNMCIIKCEGFGFGNFNKPGSASGSFTSLGNMGIPIDLSIKPKIWDSAGNFYITGSIPSDIGEFNIGASTVLGINSIKVYARITYTIIPEDSSYYGNYSY